MGDAWVIFSYFDNKDYKVILEDYSPMNQKALSKIVKCIFKGKEYYLRFDKFRTTDQTVQRHLQWYYEQRETPEASPEPDHFVQNPSEEVSTGSCWTRLRKRVFGR